jgi:glycerol uptake facilitator-like aquaporin
MAQDMISAAWRSGTTMVRAFWKFARQLFHEAVGTFFGVFSLYGAVAAWRQIHQPRGQWITVFAAAYAVMMAVFSFSAFRSARRVR